LRAFAFPRAGALFALAIAAASAGCTGGMSDTGTAQVAANAATPDSGLQITDTKVGTGISPKPGQTCIVHYTGWIYENGVKGKKFDSSVDRKKPFSFVLGEHKVIEGWERGVTTLKVGGKRTLIIPPALAYGSAGQGGTIPANATLIFEVELLEVRATS
jgi:peptidylprolyl isomerase